MQRPSRLGLLATIGLFLCCSGVCAGQTAAPSATPNPDWPTAPSAHVSAADVDKLINQFTGITSDGFIKWTTHDGFMPIRTSGGVPWDKSWGALPKPLQDVVAFGIQALPELIDHITDTRPTGVTISRDFVGETATDRMLNDMVGGMWYGDQFDVRPYDRVPRPPGTTDQLFGNLNSRIDQYRVTVGDVCFVAIGQIVHRRYQAVGYQPGCTVNSPTHTPALADAVKVEWAGLTRDEFVKSLLADAQFQGNDNTPSYLRFSEPDPDRLGAIERLCYYYPEVGKAVAISLLRQPLFNWDLTRQLPDRQELVETLSPFHDQDMDAAVADLLKDLDSTSTVSPPDKDVDPCDEEYQVQCCGLACVDYLNGRGYKSLCKEFCSKKTNLLSMKLTSIPPQDPGRESDEDQQEAFAKRIVNLK